MGELVSYFAKNTLSKIEKSNNPIEKVNQYLLFISQIILIIYGLSLIFSINVTENLIFSSYLIKFCEHFKKVSPFCTVRYLFFISFFIDIIAFLYNFIKDKSSSFGIKHPQILAFLLALKNFMDLIFRIYFLFLSIYSFFNWILFHKYTEDIFTGVLFILYLCIYIFNIGVILYKRNLARLDEIQNQKFRNDTSSGFYDLNNKKICLYDKVLINKEEYTVYKKRENDGFKWYGVKGSDSKCLLHNKKSEVLLLEEYKRYINGKCQKVYPVVGKVSDKIAIISTIDSLEKILDYFQDTEKIVLIDCIWILRDGELNADEELKLHNLLFNHLQAADSKIVFNEKDFSKYVIYSEKIVSTVDIQLNKHYKEFSYYDVNNQTNNALHIEHNQLNNEIGGKWKYVVKRIFDLTFSLLLIIVSLPIMFLIYIIIFLKDGVPVTYSTKRVGMNGRIIEIKKFRTMRSKEEAKDFIRLYMLYHFHIPPVDPRITFLGYYLRRTGLDELPCLFSILKGDMSFIGIRPLMIPEFNNQIKLSHIQNTMKPGLLFPHKRDFCEANQVYMLNKQYMENWNLKKDFQVIKSYFTDKIEDESLAPFHYDIDDYL